MSQPQDQAPTVISLNALNTVQVLSQYVEVAQQKGAYKLNEAEVLKRASDVLLNNASDHEINDVSARQLLVQGVLKGQSHGAYTLTDAALLSKVVQFVTTSLQNNEPFPRDQLPVQATPTQEAEQVKQSGSSNLPEFDDLSDLAEPIPLKPKEI
jgi:hypothetical protein